MNSNVSPEAAARELLRRRRGRESLQGFAQAIEIPGAPVSEDPDEWLFRPVETSLAVHHSLLLRELQRCMFTRYGRLMVFMPPGSAKSTYCSVVGPTWYMGRVPGSRLILGCYGDDLARRHGRRGRQIVRSPAYTSLFGAGLDRATKAADEWAITNGSEYLAGGLLSGMTGNRAHGVVVDDPIKGREAAESPTIRDKTWEAWKDDLQTRLLPGGWVVWVQTRWHEDDPAGRLLPKNYKGESGDIECRDGRVWRVINLPAECEYADDPLGRQPGEMLWTEWFDDEHWAPFRLDERTWSSLFQQRPRPAEGGVFKSHWCRFRWAEIPVQAKTIVHSWDTAQKENQVNDPTAGSVWHLGRGVPGFHLREMFVDRIDYTKLRRTVINYAERDRPSAILIEDKSSGQSLIQDLRNSTSLPIVAIEPESSKLFRAMDVSPMVESGLLLLPEVAPWLVDFEREFFAYPLSTHDDQVDSVTQFLRWARTWGDLVFEGAGITRAIAAEAQAQAQRARDGGTTSLSIGSRGADSSDF